MTKNLKSVMRSNALLNMQRKQQAFEAALEAAKTQPVSTVQARNEWREAIDLFMTFNPSTKTRETVYGLYYKLTASS